MPSFLRSDSLTDTTYGGDGSALPYFFDQHIGETYRGKPILDHAGVIAHIDTGYDLVAKNGVVTYSFLDGPTTIGIYNNPKEGFPEPGGYSPMSPAEQAVAREAMKLWDDLIPLSFVEKNGNGADILFANTTSGPAQAWAYYPDQHKYGKVASDVWTADPSANWTNQWLNYSGYGWTTIVHETGHTLGLSHPGAYNFGPGFTVNYQNGAEYAQDSRQFSIMSYWNASETGARPLDVWVGLANYPQTPMIDDILTIQSKYGADTTTRAGNTTYGFNSNAGDAIYDFTKNHSPTLAIYDAGGNDTIDMSGANSGVFLDLHAGSFSSGGVRPTLDQANAATAEFNAVTDATQGDFAPWTQASLDSYLNAVGVNRAAQIQAMTGVSGINALSFENLSIAYNTTIENATGGSLRDLLWGNDVANILTGLGGDDVLKGFGGNDTLIGGAGNDTFVFVKDGSVDTINDFLTGADKIDLTGIVGGTAANTTYNASNHTLNIDVDHNGTTDVSVIVLGSAVNLGSDVLFHA
jgi:serralysin